MDPVHRFGEQVVVLGGLQRNVDARQRADLAAPQPGRVHDVLGFDGSPVGDHPRHATASRREPCDGDVLDEARPAGPGSLRERHRDVHRIGPTLVGDVEPGEDVVGLGDGPERRDLRS